MRAELRAPVAAVLAWLLAASAVPARAAAATGATGVERLDAIAATVEDEIRAGHVPGAVVIVGHDGRVVYRRAFGLREIAPERAAMTADTIFDLASLTKVVATTTAVLQLVERGKIALDAPAARYWPAFAANGKRRITIEQLLTHRSGLRPDLDLDTPWRGKAAALSRIAAERPRRPPGTSVVYSDINFEALGEIVARVAGEPLDAYCARHVFEPLGMRDTSFHPADAARVAPTGTTGGVLRRARVHDPTAERMGGVAGHAGLFSTAADLARFAEALLAGGSAGDVAVLRPETVARMAARRTPPGGPARGLGWEIGSALGPSSFGHTGYTGTSLWIDPASRSYVVILTNRVHPDGAGDARPVRRRVAAIVADALGAAPAVASGIDVLAAERFAPLRGLRFGLVTNDAAVDASGRRTIDVLDSAAGVRLVALFSPEHGLRADAEGPIASGREPATRLPVTSLYGSARRPTPAMLAGLDALVFDVPDAGVRFYTYVTTMAYAMEAAARRGIPFFVLDRPNPINAVAVQGPMLEPDLRSFTGYHPLPVRYGMTIGELARLLNAESSIHADLRVIALRGYRREQWYDETGLPWRSPSPNLRSVDEAALYPGVGLVEGGRVSVGRGTGTPFELVGAPWIDAEALAAYLEARGIEGVRFAPADFTPEAAPYRGQRCHGIRLAVVDRERLDAPALGIEIASALERLHPGRLDLAATLGMIGDRATLEALRAGEDPRAIVARWRSPLERFRVLRAKYLIY